MFPSESDAHADAAVWSPSPWRRLVRHRGVYWTIAATLAVIAGIGVHRQGAEARDLIGRLGATVDVVRVESELAPGDPIAPAATDVAVPVGLAPALALRELADDAVAGRRVPAGALLTELDIADVTGPGAGEAAIAVPSSVSTPPTRPGDPVVLVVAGDPFVGIEPRLVDARVAASTDDRVVVVVAREDLADVAASIGYGSLSVASG